MTEEHILQNKIRAAVSPLSDGRAVFIEVKTKTGRPTKKQKNFIQKMREYGAIAGVCRSADEAIKLITEVK